ncbi:MAG: hypothetical protein Q4A78_13260 [Peptostreptococcaceae bacterium]|nr:hypothetical protein [Peptostreptococcaceae bacterium]
MKSRNVGVKEAAQLLGKSEQFVRIGLQREKLPFGVALQVTGRRYSYHISRKKLEEYIGGGEKNSIQREAEE